MAASADFEATGFLVTAPLLDAAVCDALAEQLEEITLGLAGTRSLLHLPWCRALAAELQAHPALAGILPGSAQAILCTLFEKSRERNWLVPLHQDLSIPVAQQIAHPLLSGWSLKEGVWHVQPPASLLQQLLAVRLHIDVCDAADGALRVVPGSHRQGRLDAPAIAASKQDARICPVGRGAALLMRPTLLHGSAKSTGSSRRRVLHFLFGPPALPFGLAWHDFAAIEKPTHLLHPTGL